MDGVVGDFLSSIEKPSIYSRYALFEAQLTSIRIATYADANSHLPEILRCFSATDIKRCLEHNLRGSSSASK